MRNTERGGKKERARQGKRKEQRDTDRQSRERSSAAEQVVFYGANGCISATKDAVVKAFERKKIQILITICFESLSPTKITELYSAIHEHN